MNAKWVISWINWYDYELHSQIIDAPDEMTAYRKALAASGIDGDDEEFNTVEEVKCFAFNCDGMVNAICIS